MSERPIAYVMEQTLGSITHYLNLRSAESLGGAVPPLWVPIEYSHSFLPWTVPGSWAARKALQPIIPRIDGVFVHTMTLALALFDVVKTTPVVISGDGTPLAKRDMRRAYGLPAQTRAAEFAKREVFRRVFRGAAGFVAWSTWTKQSFVDDYGCRDEDVAVIPPGTDLTLFAPGQRDHELPRVLFVGGDFVRKGGDLLLEVFRERLRGRAELVLVTGADVPEEPGVSVHRGLQANSEELRQLYATCDVFALPTRADCYSLVCMEALAAGMPVVTTRVGGIEDLVKEGETGHLVDIDDAQQLGDRLLSLVSDAGKRREMGLASRDDAAARFDARDNARALFEFVRSRC